MPKCYDVNGIKKLGSELSYNDVKLLYSEYYKTYGEYPNYSRQKIEYNVPHNKILARVLKEKGITLNDFQNEFNVSVHVRSDPNNYDLYLDRYIKVCSENEVLGFKELSHNTYGLPTAGFFVKYCPDKSVKTYWDFVRWCGFDTFKKDKDDVIKALIDLESKLGRAIRMCDITTESVGFSPIVITRIWGNLNNCKTELGLKATEYKTTTIPFEDYLKILDLRLDEIKEFNKHNVLTWRDLEDNKKFKTKSIEHHTALSKFKENGLSFTQYINDKGFIFNPSSYGYSGQLENGELYKSKKEMDYSIFLNELGFRFGVDYFRDVMYKTFCDGLSKNSKINCDYMINYNGRKHYIEIAGILESEESITTNFKQQVPNKYKDKIILKQNILKKSGVDCLFLYANDMINDSYKQKTINYLGIN